MNEKIKKVFKEENLEQINEIKKLSFGKWGNKFLVNNKYIIKFNPKQELEFAKENYVLEHFRELPVPKLIRYNSSRKLIPEEYIIEEKINGENLSKIWPNLDSSEKEEIFRQIIAILKKFHKTNFNFYGEITSNNKFEKWSDFVERRYKSGKSFAAKTGMITDKEFDLIDDFYDSNRKYLDNPNLAACFCHGDLHFGNILINEGKITGILDYDLSCAAPFDYEFELPICFFRQPTFFVDNELGNNYQRPLIECENWLKKYYPELYKIPHLAERIGIYSIVSDMKMLWLCEPFGYSNKVKQIIKNRLLKTLENGFKL